MPSVKEIYHKIDDVRIEADTINLNVDGLEALASTQQADVAAIKADIANGVTINQPVAVTDNNGSLTVDGTVTANLDNNNFAVALSNYVDNVTNHGAFPVEISYQPSVTIGSLPAISGTVTADSNRGNLTAASTQSITTGGTHQQVFASNASRKFLLVQNLSDTDMYLGIGFNPSNTTPDGILLSKSGGGIVFESSYIPTQEIRIVCATTGKRFEALEA